MKKQINGLILIPILTLALAAGARAEAAPVQKPWPTHAPEATPYVRTHDADAVPVPSGAVIEHYSSREEAMRALYEEVGHFYFHDWELEMFRNLPQEEPFSFVPHSASFSLDKSEAMRLAHLFAEQEGCTAKVKAMYQLIDGRDDWGYIPVVTMTPARMFQLSEEIDEPIFFEQLYDAVDERFDRLYWDGTVLDGEDYINLAYEKVGSFYFVDEELRYLRETEQDTPIILNVLSPDGTRWDSFDAGMAAFQTFADRQIGEASVVQTSTVENGTMTAEEYEIELRITPNELFSLAEELPGEWLIRLSEKQLDVLAAEMEAEIAAEVNAG